MADQDKGPLGIDAQFQRHLDKGVKLRRSRKSGRAFHYQRVAEPGTGDTDLE
jgi:hypothetical protein